MTSPTPPATPEMIAELTARIAVLERKIVRGSKARQALQAHNGQLMQSIHEHVAKKREACERAAAAAAEAEKLRAENVALRARDAAWTLQVGEMEADMAERDRAIAALSRPASTAGEAVEALVSRMEERAAGKRAIAKSIENRDAAAFYESHAVEIERDLATVRALIAAAPPSHASPSGADDADGGSNG